MDYSCFRRDASLTVNAGMHRVFDELRSTIRFTGYTVCHTMYTVYDRATNVPRIRLNFAGIEPKSSAKLVYNYRGYGTYTVHRPRVYYYRIDRREITVIRRVKRTN